ncbi:reverse transcriptase domain-containing protein [Tanacetum coccineum]
MAESDEEKTAFHTSQGVYCYTKMPFGLKNAGATYQRLVDKAFDSQIGRNIEVYVDDLVIKSYTEAEMLRDIDETFLEGMFLGYMISPEGIKPCPDKTEAVLQLSSPLIIKEVQSLNGKLASLNRFLSKSAEKSLPLFKTLKKCIKKSDFHWTSEAEQAFKQLKQHLSELPLLVAPKPKEELIVYLSASHGAISAVLMTERGTRYAGRTQYHVPAKDIRERTDPSGFPCREAGRSTTRYVSGRNPTRAVDIIHGRIIMCRWVRRWLNTDKPGGTEFTYALRFQFTASNNEAKYETLIAGLRIAAQMGVRNVHVSVDSKLVANQVLGTYVAKEENMVKYLEKAKSLISGFANFSISQVLVEALKEKSIQEEEVATVVEEGPTWMTPIIKYLKDETLPDDRKEASKLHIKARQYELLEGVLYRRSFLKPWLSSTRWGLRVVLDLAGPSGGTRKVKFFNVAMDYFLRCGIEAKAVATITGNQVKKFVDNPFKDWCEKLNITQRFASVKHPQSNRLVKRANRSLSEGIKARLGERNKNWIEELPHVLWAHRTMIKSSHGDTPFSLTYGTEAVIPAEIRMPTYRTAVVDAVHNDEELRLNLDLLEERHEHAAIREAKAKLKMTKYYNARVRGVTFRPGDFVYRSNEASHAMDGDLFQVLIKKSETRVLKWKARVLYLNKGLDTLVHHLTS